MRRWVLDSETAGLGTSTERPRVLLTVATDGAEWIECWGESSICEVVERCVSRTSGECEVWAHNGGGFDFRLLLDDAAFLEEMGDDTDLLTTGSIILQLSTRVWNGRLRLRDSMRLLPSSLKRIGEALGMAKGDVRHEHDEHCESDPCGSCLAKTNDGRARLLDYCRNDCAILLRAIEQMEDILRGMGVERMRLTLASNAAQIISAKAGGWPSTPHGEDGKRDVDLEVEEGYFGGRTEKYRDESGPGKTYDANSAYSWAMAGADLPWTYLGCGKGRPRRSDALAVVEATVEVTRDEYLPVLPFRVSGEAIYFPTGKWRGMWTWEELQYAESRGSTRIARVHGHELWEGTSGFRDFALEGWEIRRRSTGFLQYAVKILLNTGYGKSVEGREKERVIWRPRDVRGLTRYHESLPLWHKQYSYQPKFRCVAAGAHICARVRCLLHEAMAGAISSGGELYASDTDGFSTNIEIETGIELGQWKVERQFSKGVFYAPKCYVLWPVDGGMPVVKAKGFSNITADGLDRVMKGGGTWEQERTMGARESFRRGRIGYARVRVDKRRIEGTRPKRRPVSGGDSVPWDVRDLSC